MIPLEMWECPGNSTLDAIDAPLTQFSTLIFVIDIQVRTACLWRGSSRGLEVQDLRRVRRTFISSRSRGSQTRSSRRTSRIHRCTSRSLCTRRTCCQTSIRLVCVQCCSLRIANNAM